MRSPRMAQEQQGQVCDEDRGHLLTLLSMSLREIYELAYRLGYEDGYNQASSQQDQSDSESAG